MVGYVVVGFALAFSAAIQPGPLQAYLLSKVASVGWRKTLPAALAPLLSDGPIAILALWVLGQLSVTLQSVLRLAGAGLLFYFAFRTFQQWYRHDSGPAIRVDKVPRTVLEAAMVNFLNPNPWLGWTLILGPVVISAWQEAPSSGVAVVASFYLTMVVTLALVIYAFGSMRLLDARWQRALLLISGVILAALSAYQFVVGVRNLSEM